MAEYIEREAAIIGLAASSLMPHQIDDAAEALKLVPAADVAPVRHGRWIKDGDEGPVYCSECGEEHEWEDYRASYCDCCGAKMDGSEEVR